MTGRYVKKLLALFWAVLIICSGVAAAEGYTRGIIETVDVKMPQIQAFVNIVDDEDNIISLDNVDPGDVSAMLNDTPLAVESVMPYSDSSEGTTYFLLLDVSRSANEDFGNVRSSIIDWINSSKPQDRFVLITFGEQIDVVLTGTEDKTDAAELVGNLEAGDRQTLYFDGLYRAINIAESENAVLPKRKIFVVVTDGEDYSKGGVTSNELSSKLTQTGIPMYSVMVSAAQDDYLSKIGELSRETGGKVISLKDNNCNIVFEKLIEELNSGFVVNMLADNNIIDNTMKTLRIIVKNDSLDINMYKEIQIKESIPDIENPMVTEVEVKNNKEIVITFNEEVIGADKINNFTIIDANGSALAIITCDYDELNTKLVLAENIYNGTYKLEMGNIKDNSMEHNLLSDDVMEFEVKDMPELSETTNEILEEETITDEVQEQQNPLINIIVIIAAAFVISYMIIRIIRKRRKVGVNGVISQDNDGVVEEPEEPEEGYGTIALSKNFRILLLEITDPGGVPSDINVEISDSIVIGRSSTCDLALVDEKISRKQCRIIQHDGCYFVEDLNSTNGTKVNGNIIAGLTALNIGDEISMGSHKIKYKG